MYLKSIDVQGFKSFANKIKFEFHEGITGIVGPNGSGKSNVADAVRWVLGEQRVKQLRGGNMQDVIFSGTENRKPLSYASVAITLDNSDGILPIDYKEVTVTRKLYRSGESEYLLNGVNCRLKTINELFYDTGIGKEGYSIIGQGQIDKILSGKPEERRELFDEAAGIVKFKRRKNQSLKKLEEERLNLTRVNDILVELEKQAISLEQQSTVARAYLKKKEELKTYDINMFLLETGRLKDLIRALEADIANTTRELGEAEKKHQEMKSDYEAVEEEIEASEVAVEQVKTQLNDTKLLKQQLEGQIEVLKEQIKMAHLNDAHYNSRVNTIQTELQERAEQKTILEEEQKAVRVQLSEVHVKDERLKAELVKIQSKIAEDSEKIDQHKGEIYSILNNRAGTKAQIQHLETTKYQLLGQKDELGNRLQKIELERGEHQRQMQDLEKGLKTSNEKISAFATLSREIESRIETLQGSIASCQTQLRIGETAFHREESRLESLKNITERYEGYGNSIKKIMSGNQRNPGLLGVVADIIKVEKDYELAVETALGGSIQNIVADTEETAKKTIAYLKQNKLGRATFLPLTSMTGGGNFPNQQALKEEGVIGLAHTLVTVETRYLGLAKQLLGRTLVVRHIDDAISIGRKYRHALRIVTLEGDLINPGGSMTGGAFRNSSNLLSRRREIEEFEGTIQKLRVELAEKTKELAKIKDERSQCYQELEDVQKEKSRESVNQNTISLKLEQVKNHVLGEEKRYLAIKAELGQVERKCADNVDNAESIQVELETSEVLEEKLSKEVAVLEQSLVKDRDIESTQMKQAEEIHLVYAGLEQRNGHINENMNRINEEMQKHQDELTKLKENKNHSYVQANEKEEKIAALSSAIEDANQLIVEIQVEIEGQILEKEALSKKYKKYLEKREDLSKHMAELDKENYRLTSRRANYEENVEKQINYMWEEYELTYNHGLELRDESLIDLPFMKKQIQLIRSEIKKLGDVNVNSIEEYKSVSERYTFLKEQHDDLVDAEETLVQIIEELDVAMRKQFQAQFALISKEFDKVFQELFGGGIATLELMEEMDVLDAGIKIIAQPPGKKLQNMMQLSGGEKALTAIALLFAIQNLKPSPFCVLDEIEAALDDTNVIRFAKYLHKLSHNTQFITITHRRGTMTTANRLYGITMQEKGVSTLVSVDLLEGELN